MVVVAQLLLSWALVCLSHSYRGLPPTNFPNQSPSNYQRPWVHKYPQGQHWSRAPVNGWGSSSTPSPVVNNPPSTTASLPQESLNRMDLPVNTTQLPPAVNSVPQNQRCQMNGQVYEMGEKWTSEGGCARHTCAEGGRTTTLGCPTVTPSDLCTLSEEDPRQPWPFCCPQLNCPQGLPSPTETEAEEE